MKLVRKMWIVGALALVDCTTAEVCDTCADDYDCAEGLTCDPAFLQCRRSVELGDPEACTSDTTDQTCRDDCCVVCDDGGACGDYCRSPTSTCNEYAGCACNADDVC